MKLLKVIKKIPGEYPSFGTKQKFSLHHSKVEACHGSRISTIMT
jgi:hypothetical protein